MWKIGNQLQLLLGLAVETSIGFLNILKIELYNPAVPL